jgi:hypothetical protein
MTTTVHAETDLDCFGKTDLPISHNGEVSVEWLLTNSGTGMLETGAREYQREKVAPLQWKQNILRTILTDTYAKIPQIHIRVKNLGGAFYFEAVDGQQRITSLVDFLNNKFPLANGLKTFDNISIGGLTAKELREKYPHILNRIKNYRITTIWYENLDDDQISRLFVEVLNNTNDMKPQEIRNAIRGLLSTYIRNKVRYEDQHKLFTRITIGTGNKAKTHLKHLPKLALKGRMEADEWLSQLIYLNEVGPTNGVSNQKLTEWVRDVQLPGNKAAIGSESKFKPIQKRCDELLDFSYKIITSVDSTNRHKVTPMSAMLMILYAIQIEKTGQKISDVKAYTDAYFDVIARWSDTKTKLYINRKTIDGKQMPPMVELFGGKNSNAIGTIFKILDEELDKNPHVFGIIKLDDRESFKKSDILKKWKEQDKKCFYTGRLLTEDQLVGDHFVPRSWGIAKGGVTEYENLRVTDAQTNLKKLNMHGDDFMRLIKKTT